MLSWIKNSKNKTILYARKVEVSCVQIVYSWEIYWKRYITFIIYNYICILLKLYNFLTLNTNCCALNLANIFSKLLYCNINFKIINIFITYIDKGGILTIPFNFPLI
ncbi:hypothetical protein H312_01359 [Anncaliia algerae PRA339]|uniref:Uncharacterized protein n=1 Tax=Anncaliia algerae PRA339 TaxID=1288291 RepID=A0A059F1Q0_9MICR|nr:hypothetical protein H312_01359 [Anncaliia algerae PRA339]